jgi:hypothetical protein
MIEKLASPHDLLSQTLHQSFKLPHRMDSLRLVEFRWEIDSHMF